MAEGIADKIGDKLKSLFSFGKEKQWEKKGKGHRLGTAEETGVGQANGAAAANRQQQPTARPAARSATSASGVSSPELPPLSQRTSDPSKKGVEKSKVSRLSEREPNIDHGIMVSTPTSRESHLIHGMAPAITVPEPPTEHFVRVESINTPTAAERRLTSFTTAQHEDEFHLQHCLALVVSQPECLPTLETIVKILTNIVEKPEEPKYRQIRLTNPKIQALLVDTVGAVEFLEACGFKMQLQDTGEDKALEGHLMLPGGADLRVLPHALHMLRMQVRDVQVAGSSTQESSTPVDSGTPRDEDKSTSSAASLQIVPTSPLKPIITDVSRPPRNTQVVLPVTPDTEVPDWFFERTGADVKAEYFAVVKKREAGETLTTRAYKERKAGESAVSQSTATIRVRFPEGVNLQGHFGASESTAAVFDWVTESLRSPDIEYELITPNRKALVATGTIKSHGLVGLNLLNFRLLGTSSSKGLAHVSLIKDSLVQLAQVDVQ